MSENDKNQANIVKDELEMIPFTYFFRFCTVKDKIMLAIGSVSVLLAGGFMPVVALFLGGLLESMGPGVPAYSTFTQISWACKWIMVIGCGELAAGYLYYAMWSHVAANITLDLRVRYVRKLLVQEVAFFEKQNIEELPSQIGETFAAIQDAIGEKFSQLLYTIITCLSALGISLYIGPAFGAIAFAYLPVVIVIMLFFGRQVKAATMVRMAT